MISGVVLAFSSNVTAVPPEGVVRSLAALVPAAIESLVADVVLLGPSADETARDDLQAIADHAGCAAIWASTQSAALRAGLAAARQDMVLVLRAGYAPGSGFVAELSELAARAATGDLRRAAILRASPRGRLRWPFWRAPAVALFAQRSALLCAGEGDLSELARRLRPDAKFACGAFAIAERPRRPLSG